MKQRQRLSLATLRLFSGAPGALALSQAIGAAAAPADELRKLLESGKPDEACRVAKTTPGELGILRMIFILAWPPSTAARPQTAHSHWQNLSVTFATLDAATGRTAGVAVFRCRSIQFIFRA